VSMYAGRLEIIPLLMFVLDVARRALGRRL
jgi:hypothetical protein